MCFMLLPGYVDKERHGRRALPFHPARCGWNAVLSRIICDTRVIHPHVLITVAVFSALWMSSNCSSFSWLYLCLQEPVQTRHSSRQMCPPFLTSIIVHSGFNWNILVEGAGFTGRCVKWLLFSSRVKCWRFTVHVLEVDVLMMLPSLCFSFSW